MKQILNIILFGLIYFIFSCGRPTENKSELHPTIDTIISVSDTLRTNIEVNKISNLIAQQESVWDEYSDSFRLDKILKKALNIAKLNINKTNFSKSFLITDSVFGDCKTRLKIDTFFSSNYRHLLITRNTSNYKCIDIYLVTNEKLEKVLSHKEWKMNYVSDSLKDINGDGYKDFVLNWYGSSGCCLKAFSNVCLFQPLKGTFTSEFEFINPTFTPNEKIIRGVCYGHSGETEMYKFKWNEDKIDTIEYIYYEKKKNGEKTGKVIKSNLQANLERKGKIIRLDDVPSEYKKIEGYDWFTGK